MANEWNNSLFSYKIYQNPINRNIPFCERQTQQNKSATFLYRKKKKFTHCSVFKGCCARRYKIALQPSRDSYIGMINKKIAR